MLITYLSIIASPLGICFLLILFALIMQLYRRFNYALILIISSFSWLYLWSTPLVSYHLDLVIESKYPPIPLEEVPTANAIVVLGGALAPPSKGFYYPNLYKTADRVWHASRLYRAGKAPLVVLSGGGDLSSALESEAKSMSIFIQNLGVPSSALILEEKSRTTSQNASMTSDLLKGRGFNHILLVTSAFHMDRAQRLFKNEGFIVEPIATDHEATIKPVGPYSYLPSAEALSGSTKSIKELFGRLLVMLDINR